LLRGPQQQVHVVMIFSIDADTWPHSDREEASSSQHTVLSCGFFAYE